MSSLSTSYTNFKVQSQFCISDRAYYRKKNKQHKNISCMIDSSIHEPLSAFIGFLDFLEANVVVNMRLTIVVY